MNEYVDPFIGECIDLRRSAVVKLYYKEHKIYIKDFKQIK